MGYYSGRCKTCRSKYKSEIHRLRMEEKWTYEEIEKWLKNKDEIISDSALCLHFDNHVYPYQKYMKEADSITQEYIKKSMEEDLTTLEKIKIQLSILESTLRTVLQGGKYLEKPSMVQQLRGLATDIVTCLEKYEKLRKEYALSEAAIDIQKVYQDFVDACVDLPLEYKKQIVNRLREKGYE